LERRPTRRRRLPDSNDSGVASARRGQPQRAELARRAFERPPESGTAMEPIPVRGPRRALLPRSPRRVSGAQISSMTPSGLILIPRGAYRALGQTETHLIGCIDWPGGGAEDAGRRSVATIRRRRTEDASLEANTVLDRVPRVRPGGGIRAGRDRRRREGRIRRRSAGGHGRGGR